MAIGQWMTKTAVQRGPIDSETGPLVKGGGPLKPVYYLIIFKTYTHGPHLTNYMYFFLSIKRNMGLHINRTFPTNVLHCGKGSYCINVVVTVVKYSSPVIKLKTKIYQAFF